MAREPYATWMQTLLYYGSEEEQTQLLKRFVIEEAGSSHSDVIALHNMEIIFCTLRGLSEKTRFEYIPYFVSHPIDQYMNPNMKVFVVYQSFGRDQGIKFIISFDTRKEAIEEAQRLNAAAGWQSYEHGVRIFG